MNNQQLQFFVNNAMQNSQLMRNPMFSNAVGMYRSRNSSDLRAYASNLCKEYGMTYEDAVKKLNGM